MITTVGKASQIRCPEDIGKKDRNCQTLNCMGWRFWIAPPGVDCKAERACHGQKDKDKRGYCGKIESH